MERFFNQPARGPSVGGFFSVNVATSLPLETNAAGKSAETNFHVGLRWLSRWFSTDDLLRRRLEVDLQASRASVGSVRKRFSSIS